MWGIEITHESEITLSRQIYLGLCNSISNAKLASGEALPSTRELAKQLNVSRNTVSVAYDMLLAEGFVISHQGAPTRVAEGLQLSSTLETESSEVPVQINTVQKETVQQEIIKVDFKTGKPDVKHFPKELWCRLLYHASQNITLEQYNYSGPEGNPALRQEIAEWLFRSRGIMVKSEDIFITAGATQALHILAGLLSSEGREMLIEDPCHIGMLRALQGKGHPIRPVPVDEFGMQTDCLEGGNAGAVYVTPSHQFPLGGILPAGRRTVLIKFARENDLYIIEDDYDSEFRYSGPPISPLYAMDPERVIYVGTFSKSVFPALRIGYVILPKRLQSQWKYSRIYTDVQNPLFEQVALAEFLRTRKLDRYVNQMRKHYNRQRQVLLEALQENFTEPWSVWGDAAGLHLAIRFPGYCFDSGFVAKSRSLGVRTTPVEHYSIVKGKHLDMLLIGYGHLNDEEIGIGIALLRDAMDKKK